MPHMLSETLGFNYLGTQLRSLPPVKAPACFLAFSEHGSAANSNSQV